MYVDDILIIKKDTPSLQAVKACLSDYFLMNDLGEASYILGIKIYRDRSKRFLGLSLSTYIDKVLERFKMDSSKKGYMPMASGRPLSKGQSHVSKVDQDRMNRVPYASAIGSIMHAMLCTRPDVLYALSITIRCQSNLGELQ